MCTTLETRIGELKSLILRLEDVLLAGGVPDRERREAELSRLEGELGDLVLRHRGITFDVEAPDAARSNAAD